MVSQEENSARESQEEITGIRRPEESETFSWEMWKVPHILKKDWREPSYYLDLADPEILCLVKYKQKTKFALPPIQMPFRKWWKPYLRCLSTHFWPLSYAEPRKTAEKQAGFFFFFFLIFQQRLQWLNTAGKTDSTEAGLIDSLNDIGDNLYHSEKNTRIQRCYDMLTSELGAVTIPNVAT